MPYLVDPCALVPVPYKEPKCKSKSGYFQRNKWIDMYDELPVPYSPVEVMHKDGETTIGYHRIEYKYPNPFLSLLAEQ